MKLRIERPLWHLHFGISGGHHDDIDTWFDENVEPINKLLREGVEVYGDNIKDPLSFWYSESGKNTTHRALLIGIEPIEHDSKDKVLEDLIKTAKQKPVYDYDKQISIIAERAKKVLGEK